MTATTPTPDIHALLAAHGLRVTLETMPNGEVRAALRDIRLGADYIRTMLSEGQDAVWQNPHYHGGPDALKTRQGLRETYTVLKGWIAYAELRDGKVVVHFCQAGETFTSEPGVEHNVMMGPGAVIHTTKHGTAVGNPEKNGADWWPASTDFEAKVAVLTVDMVFAIARQQGELVDEPGETVTATT